MKTAHIIGVFLISCLLFGASSPKMRQIGKSGVYIDKTEITIREWSEYVHYMYKKHGVGSEQFIATKCDSVAFRTQYGHVFLYPYTQGVGMMQKYGFTSDDIRFLSEEYDKHPMVGLKYEQCISFCEWRSEIYNERHRKRLMYRLPSSEELREAFDKRIISSSYEIIQEFASDTKTSELGVFRCAAVRKQ